MEDLYKPIHDKLFVEFVDIIESERRTNLTAAEIEPLYRCVL